MISIKLNSVLSNFRRGIISPRHYSTSRRVYQQNGVKVEPFSGFQAFQARHYTSPSGMPGSGAGKGGGAGGTVRESGGSLGQYGAAQEEGYFYDKQKEALKKIKKKLKDKPDPSKQDK